MLEHGIQKPLDATHLLRRHLEEALAKFRVRFPFREELEKGLHRDQRISDLVDDLRHQPTQRGKPVEAADFCIELREAIPKELRGLVGNCLFGCDACQDVCPWNRKTPTATEQAFHPNEGMNPITLAELFELDDDTFRRRFRHTPLWRAKRRGVLRNAAVVLGNRPHEAAQPALRRGIEDTEAMVREACAWALDRGVGG